MIKDFKVKAGEQILIDTGGVAARSQKDDLRLPGKAKGIIPIHRSNDYLARRRSGGINFYDLGQIKTESGEFVESDLVVFAPNSQPNADDFKSAVKAKRDALFSIDRAKWKNTYKKISYETAERYRFDLNVNEKLEPIGRNGSRNDLFTNQPITDTHWMESGLELKEAINSINFLSAFFFENFNTGDATTKITDKPDIEASSVSFTPSLSANVYLIPTIGFFTANGTPELLSDSVNDSINVRGYIAAGQVCNGVNEPGAIQMYEKTHTFAETTRVAVLNYFYTTIPRKNFLDDARWQATANGISFNQSSDSDNLKILEGWRTHPQARTSLETTATSGISYTYATSQSSQYYYSDPFWQNSYYPRAVCETRSRLGSSSQQVTESAGDVSSFSGNGNFDNVYGLNSADTDRLLAIIESNGKWFYIWQKHGRLGGGD